MPNSRLSQESALFNLWLNWIVAGAAVMLPVVLSVYVPVVALPFITLIDAVLLLLYDRSSMRGKWAVCPLIPSIAIRTLFISALAMIVITLIYKKGVINHIWDSELLNPDMPYLTALIVYPVFALLGLWSKVRGRKYDACLDCRIHLGARSERGFLGKIFGQESEYQRWMLIGVASVISAICWVYYFCFYINVNLNTPDIFFFGWVPVIFYSLSCIYLGARYFTIWAYYFQDIEGSDRRQGSNTTIRYLVINDDSIYLTRNEEEFGDVPDDNLFDTPASVTVSFREKVSRETASEYLANIMHTSEDDFALRFMYESYETTGERNVFHFICTPLVDKLPETPSFSKGKWFNLSKLERLIHNREVAPMLAAELNRLYTIAMAWKTYDADGRRLYKIKNYRPIFRFKGIQDWDVDFNSTHWLNVARFNEDKPLYRLRRLLGMK